MVPNAPGSASLSLSFTLIPFAHLRASPNRHLLFLFPFLLLRLTRTFQPLFNFVLYPLVSTRFSPSRPVFFPSQLRSTPSLPSPSLLFPPRPSYPALLLPPSFFLSSLPSTYLFIYLCRGGNSDYLPGVCDCTSRQHCGRNRERRSVSGLPIPTRRRTESDENLIRVKP